MTVHDTLKRKVKSLDGFREYKMQKKLEIMKMKQENSLIELPAVTFSKHPFSDLSASKVASTKKPLKDNTEIVCISICEAYIYIDLLIFFRSKILSHIPKRTQH